MKAFIALFLVFGLLTMSSCGDDGGEETRVDGFTLNLNTFNESSSNVTQDLMLTVNGSLADAITVSYRFEDDLAVVNDDYQATGGTIEFSPGTTSQPISFTLVGDANFELSESLRLVITYDGQETVYELTINDDDMVDSDLEQLVDGATTPDSYPSMTPVWSDEFDGTELSASSWNYELGDGCDRGICGWGNDELQSYTDLPENVNLEDGKLTITAIEQGGNYTSARITTQDKVEFMHGRIDIRAKSPTGQGIWPALWMLGANIDQEGFGWPRCGEIDIMELVGNEPDVVHGTVHYENSGQYQTSTGRYQNQSGDFSDKFHVYTLIWDKNTMSWYVDGVPYRTWDRPGNSAYPFNADFFFIMNVAVGGRWPGDPDQTTVFPQEMVLDYIRVFR